MRLFKLYTVATVLVAGTMLASCGDSFLGADPTNKLAAGGTATLSSVNSGLAATYQILLFDSYANGSYESSVYISDIQSDDIFKGGGDANDGMAGMNYAVSQFTADANHTLSGTWNIYTSGNARANSVIISCANIKPSNTLEEKTLKQYNAEGHFLRAYFTYMLWKNFGNIVFFTEPLNPPYIAPQMKADDVYKQIMSDVTIACEEGALEMSTNGGTNAGRVSYAAALMLKAAVVMYQKDQSKYAEVANDMATIIKSGKYELMNDFSAMWLNENEFCKESIFETNQLGEGKDWSSSWTGYGTNLPAYISPNELKDPSGVFSGGWGFGPVRQTTYDMFANGDTRRDASITNWATVPGATYGPRFQDTGLFLRKYAARPDYKKSGANDLNYCNNLRIYRYAETLLNYAELVVMDGIPEQQGVSAQNCLDMVRDRAFGDTNHRVTATVASIKAERHYEFVGEGKRYYDLVRWGDAASVLTENLTEFNSVRTWQDYNKYLPLPQGELDKTLGTQYPLVQNPGYAN
jgi:SusD family.